jgi:hypothetical protein
MRGLALPVSMLLAAGWSTTAWAVCETGTPQEKLTCLATELNVALSALASAQAQLDEIATYMSVDTETHAVNFTGANVYIRSGSGATDGPVNGLGNLVVGYSEDAPYFDERKPLAKRNGSHNLVVGGGASYTSFGA